MTENWLTDTERADALGIMAEDWETNLAHIISMLRLRKLRPSRLSARMHRPHYRAEKAVDESHHAGRF
jgi:hypothetical protein